ncbi:MAG: DNA polymerase III subunit delta' [Candidatus Cloacimonetes bacterium]|nr:DNA polymerase III subunit delta' [Candidatus Cloacimonadota bacterium]
MSLFNKIRGQNRALKILKTAIHTKKAGGSYLFYGSDGIGKFTTALYFGMALNCESDDAPCGKCNSCRKFLSISHPDLIYLFPTPNLKFQIDGSFKEQKLGEEYTKFIEQRSNYPWQSFSFSQKVEIRIDAVRMLIHKISLSAHEAKYKICIVQDADLMNNNTANAFLKTLEEPPPNTIILLTSCRPDFLLPTILSRCQKIPFNQLSVNDIQSELLEKQGIEASQARLIARVANGNMERALQLLEEDDTQMRETAITLKELITNQDDLGFYEFLTRNKGNPPDWLASLIIHLQIALADLAFFEHNPEFIVNIDQTNIIETMYHKYPAVDEKILDHVRFLEDCQKKLKGNVNQQLILIEIYNRIGKLFK